MRQLSRPMPSTAAGRSLNPFRVLVTHRNFRLFWSGQTLSLIGTWMQSMAQGWLALQLSDSAFLVGLVAFAGSIPILLLSFPAGVIVDRADKLRLVTLAQSLLLVEGAVLWWFTWSGHITIHWLIALATFGGLVGAFEIPARQSLMIDLVGRDDLHDAIALNSSGFNLARIVGPALGAVVIKVAGIAWCFGANALSYLTVLVGLFMIRLPARSAVVHEGSGWHRFLEGLRYMSRTRAVAVLMTITAIFAVFGTPYLTLMPVVARDLLHRGAGGYGLLLACVGIGGLSGALFLAALGARVRRGRLLAVSSLTYAALLIALSGTRSFAAAQVLLLCTGFAMIVNGALLNGMLQAHVPDALRGRLMAAYSFIAVGCAQTIGALLAGLVAEHFGVEWAIGAGAGVMLGFSLWVFRRFPELRAL